MDVTKCIILSIALYFILIFILWVVLSAKYNITWKRNIFEKYNPNVRMDIAGNNNGGAVTAKTLKTTNLTVKNEIKFTGGHTLTSDHFDTIHHSEKLHLGGVPVAYEDIDILNGGQFKLQNKASKLGDWVTLRNHDAGGGYVEIKAVNDKNTWTIVPFKNIGTNKTPISLSFDK